MENRNLPNAPISEMEVLKALFHGKLDVNVLCPEDFYAPSYRSIYNVFVMSGGKEREQVMEEIREVVGRDWDVQWLQKEPIKYSFHLKVLYDKTRVRRMIEIATELADEGFEHDEDIDYNTEAIVNAIDRAAITIAQAILKRSGQGQ